MSWFTTKKVEGAMTLSEKLSEARRAMGVDLDMVSDQTKISKKYLMHLEEGRLNKLPAQIYVKGFLKKLADFYSVDEKSFYSLYCKEESIRNNIDKSQYPAFNLRRSPTFIITPKTLTVLALGIVLVSFVAFFGYQISSIFKGPELTIDYPPDELSVNYSSITISGSIKDLGATVLINNEAISLKDGKISEPFSLTPGLNIIKISATNRFKKSSEITKRIILRSEEARR